MLEIPVAENKYDSHIILLRSIVSRHQRIIAFADSIEDVFCYMALMQFLLNTFVICFLGFVIVTVSNLTNLFQTEFCDLFEGSRLWIVVVWHSWWKYSDGKDYTLLCRREFRSFYTLLQWRISRFQGEKKKRERSVSYRKGKLNT